MTDKGESQLKMFCKVLIASIACLPVIISECISGNSIFERSVGLQVHIPQTDPPYPVTVIEDTALSNCYEDCAQNDECSGFFMDQENNTCYLLRGRADSLVQQSVSNLRWSFHRKLCIQGFKSCPRLWAFERITNMQLYGYDDKTLQDVDSRDPCLEACARESTFVCRSARYEPPNRICVLSRYDRRTAPESFRKTANEVDYLENQCIEEPLQCQFLSMDGHHVVHGHTLSVEDARTQEECERTCVFYTNFTCRSYVFDRVQFLCLISPDETQHSPEDSLQQDNRVFVKRGSCIEVEMKCESTSMTAVVKVSTPFRGRVYALGHPYDCYTVTVTDNGEVSLTMPLHGRRCGTRNTGNGTFVNSIVVQHHPFVLRNTDRRVNVACDYEEVHRKLRAGKQVLEGDLQTLTQVVTGLAPTPPIRLRVVNTSGDEVSGVELGDPLMLKVDMLDESVFGIFGSGLVARSGQGAETILLLDDKGCPVEPTVFPALQKMTESKSLVAPFQAFRFASDSAVKFQMTVSFCLDACTSLTCKEDARNESLETFGRRRRSANQQGSLNLQSGDVITDVTMESSLFVVKSLKPTLSTGEKGHQKMPTPTDANPSVAVSDKGLCFTKPVLISVTVVAGVVQLILCSLCIMLLVLNRKSRRCCSNNGSSSRASISSKSELFGR